MLLSLPTRGAREQLLDVLRHAAYRVRGVALPAPPEARLHEQTERWRHGLIDNFTYLLYLNDAAGRSMADLAQYAST